ncbi:unnamed protein product [Phytomonas sp. Hart1]|nr:unnamed protein product [Phytomonas sp. Hart1]|eukprot:CCW71011.1 unnamed protein product [Phytomonas sp. isolate Hart1]
MKSGTRLLFRVTSPLFLKGSKLSQYEQEAFESHQRFVKSESYPGSIRAATPGDTRFYIGAVETILKENERHYWRAVVDDPQVQFLIPLRIRFKTNVWVTSGWETRLQVVQVMVSKDATIKEVINNVIVENQSPYLCMNKFYLSIDGKELDESRSLGFYEISSNTQIDAIEELDHLSHMESARPKDWNVDEITDNDLKKSPYKEMGMEPKSNLSPRYEGKPAGYFGKNNYSGMRQRSS